MAKGHDIILKPYVLSNMEANILAIRDVIKQHDPVLFTRDGAYAISTQLAHILNLQNKISTITNYQYVVTGKLKPPDTKYQT